MASDSGGKSQGQKIGIWRDVDEEAMVETDDGETQFSRTQHHGWKYEYDEEENYEDKIQSRLSISSNGRALQDDEAEAY